jgi:hypothetical protein
MASYSCAQFIVSRAFLVALRPETTYSVDGNGVPVVPPVPIQEWTSWHWKSSNCYSLLYEPITALLNQSMVRDGLVGGWVQLLKPTDGTSDEVIVKMTHPTLSVTAFATQMEAMLKIATEASKIEAPWTDDVRFLASLGQPMLNYTAVQLQYHRPMVSRTFCDYLYSPATARTDSLFIASDVGGDLRRFDRIIDILPAATDMSRADLEKFSGLFTPYALRMLDATLLPPGFKGQDKCTAPLVVMGPDATNLIVTAFPAQFNKTPTVGELVIVKGLVSSAPEFSTAVLFAYDPTDYLSYTEVPYSQWMDTQHFPNLPALSAYELLTSDILATSWLAYATVSDPFEALAKAKSALEQDNLQRLFNLQSELFSAQFTASRFGTQVNCQDVKVQKSLMQGMHPTVTDFSKLVATVQFYANQSLLRDGMNGGWVQIIKPDSTAAEWDIKVTHPTADVSGFVKQITKFFGSALPNAMKEWQAWCQQHTTDRPANWGFCMPEGLPLMNYQSVQLLHNPPNKSLDYYDYLYAQTITRWDDLLVSTGISTERVRLQHCIVDIVPVGTPSWHGPKMKELLIDAAFPDFVKAMLDLCLVPPTYNTTGKTHTLPMVAFGAPVRDLLWSLYKDQMEPQVPNDGRKYKSPMVGDVYVLTGLVNEHPTLQTSLLIANHPASYPHFVDYGVEQFWADPRATLTQDMPAAEWNGAMSTNPEQDPHAAMATANSHWVGADEKLYAQFCAQNTEFSAIIQSNKQWPAFPPPHPAAEVGLGQFGDGRS